MRSSALAAMGFLALAFPCTPADAAVVYHDDPITSNEVWPGNGTVHVVGWLEIPQPYGVTIQPGAIVKFKGQGALVVNGKLRAPGTIASPTYFTSVKDDSLGGDTNGDGGATTPGKGDWGGVWFNDTSVDYVPATGAGSVLRFCNLRYGGWYFGGAPQLGCANAAPGIFDTEIRWSVYTGLQIAGPSTPYVDIVKIRNCDQAGIRMTAPGPARFTNVEVYDCGINGIHVDYATIPSGTTCCWSYCLLVWYLDHDVTVEAGAKLSVEPGTILKVINQSRLVVDGELRVQGTAVQRVDFTSGRDDTLRYMGDPAGGDTNGDGGATTPAAGDWGGIAFSDSSTDYVAAGSSGSMLRYSNLRYCGQWANAAYASISSTDASPGLIKTKVQYSSGQGISLDGASSPIIDGCEMRDCTYQAILLKDPSDFTLTDCWVSNCGWNGIYVDYPSTLGNLRWRNYGLVWGTHHFVEVPAGATLTIDPGVILKFTGYGGISTSGTLRAVGTRANPIVMTSQKHDVGYPGDVEHGDTNNDGNTTTPGPTDWREIRFWDSSTDYGSALGSGSVMDYCDVSYGGWWPTIGPTAMVTAQASAPGVFHSRFGYGQIGLNCDGNGAAVGARVENCVSYRNYYGITAEDSAAPLYKNNTVYGCSEVGIGLYSSASPKIRNCIVADGAKWGIWVEGGATPTITFCNVHNNAWGNYGGIPDPTGSGGNMSGNPRFALIAKDDYHLKSQAGRYDPKTDSWVTDTVHSPCIDMGRPTDDASEEPSPNGDRINMGAYGNTAEASKSLIRPDMRGRLAGTSSWQYNDEYGRAGLHVIATGVTEGQTAVFELSIQNDGAATETFRIHGKTLAGRWQIRYFNKLSGGTDITAKVASTNGWSTGPLAAGKSRQFRVEVTAADPAAANERRSSAIAAIAQSDGTTRDAVKVVTRVRRRLQPDARVKLPAASAWTGNNVYNTAGAGQVGARTVAVGKTAAYHLSMQNDGNAPDTLRIKGPASQGKWIIRYFNATAGGSNITGQVTGAGWKTPQLNPGKAQAMRVEVRAKAGTPGGAKSTVLVTATSLGQSTLKDAVKAVTTVRSTSSLAGCQVTSLAALPTRAGAQVTFTLSAPARVSLQVLNIAGRPVRAIAADRPFGKGVQSLVWDRRSDTGLAVPSGVYVVRIAARDAEGGQSTAITPLTLP